MMATQANYSFSGAFRPLSKLIVCLVMLRGRHRGLPVAIDRAVVLPFEYRRDSGGTLPGSVGVARRLSTRGAQPIPFVGVHP
jgi:Cation transport protein